MSDTRNSLLAQISSLEGGFATLVPLIATDTDETYEGNERTGRDLSELRLVPTPPLPIRGSEADTVTILAQIEHSTAEVVSDQAKLEAQYATLEDRVEQLRRLNAAADAFKLFHTLWIGLVEGSTATPSIFAGCSPSGSQGNDSIPLERLYVLGNVTETALDEVLLRMKAQYAFERSDKIEEATTEEQVNSGHNQPEGVRLTMLHGELANDSRGNPIEPGDLVRPTEQHGGYGGGPVVAVAGDQVVFCYDANYPPRYECYRASDLEVLTDMRGFNTLLGEGGHRNRGTMGHESVAADTVPQSPETTNDGSVDANGTRILPGDFVSGTDDVISSGFPAAGIVVAVAGNAMLLKVVNPDGTHRYEGIDTCRYIVMPRG